MFLLNAEHDVVLFPGHLAVLETSRRNIFLKVWDTQALIDAGKIVRPDDVSPIITIPFENSMFQKRPRVRLSCHASPPERDTYTLWGFVSTRDTTAGAYYQKGTVISKFEVSLYPSLALSQTLLKHIDGEEYAIAPSSEISYTGHVGAYDAVERRMLVLSLAHMPLPSKKGGVPDYRNPSIDSCPRMAARRRLQKGLTTLSFTTTTDTSQIVETSCISVIPRVRYRIRPMFYLFRLIDCPRIDRSEHAIVLPNRNRVLIFVYSWQNTVRNKSGEALRMGPHE
jgi:hypothetical protein